MCGNSKGWAQLDTKQDASYYGNWINPITRELFSYCEGDTTHTVCTDDADFIAAARECIEWHKERDYFLGIDPGWPDTEPRRRITEAFERLGMGEFLH
jgi:hypothetical protein